MVGLLTSMVGLSSPVGTSIVGLSSVFVGFSGICYFGDFYNGAQDTDKNTFCQGLFGVVIALKGAARMRRALCFMRLFFYYYR